MSTYAGYDDASEVGDDWPPDNVITAHAQTIGFHTARQLMYGQDQGQQREAPYQSDGLDRSYGDHDENNAPMDYHHHVEGTANPPNVSQKRREYDAIHARPSEPIPQKRPRFGQPSNFALNAPGQMRNTDSGSLYAPHNLSPRIDSFPPPQSRLARSPSGEYESAEHRDNYTDEGLYGRAVGHQANGKKRLLVKDTNIPPSMRKIFKFESFNPMQSVMFDDIFNKDENVVVAAPTGAGKTVLFELALLRMLSEKGNGKAVYLAPTKALCSERLADWSKRLKSLKCPVLEMTGDSQAYTRDAVEAARLIVATPEKWDAITRRPGSGDVLVDKVHLFMLDEIHSVREKVRGARLEVIVARMKTRLHSMRIVGVSATIPNAEDIAQWIGFRRAGHAKDGRGGAFLLPRVFSEDYRPCPLQKVILGYPNRHHESQYYRFESELNRSVPKIVQQYSNCKPALIFCTSRKGTVNLAKSLQQEIASAKAKGEAMSWPQPDRATRLPFADPLLSELSEHGIGFHHAGLEQRDRKSVEQAYLDGNLKILCATTTLSVGVNLPAYLVIVRGTKTYTGEWEDLSDVTVLQMMGRAGRPAFDVDGVCVIMTSQEQREEWGNLLEGKTIIESTLHIDLVEHINAEICVRTVALKNDRVDYQTRGTQQSEIEDWLKQTFFFVRMSKNPRHYALPGCEGLEDPAAIVTITVNRILAELAEHNLIVDHSALFPLCGSIIAPQGSIMSDYSLRFKTMLSLLALNSADLKALIRVVCEAEEFSGMFVRSGEKAIYETLAQSGSIRFEPARVQSYGEKISVLLQASLAGISVSDVVKQNHGQSVFINPTAELQQIWKIGPNVARAALAVALWRKDGEMAFAAFQLSRSLFGRSWDDTSATLQQVPGIGPSGLSLLGDNGIVNINDLAHSNARNVGAWLEKSLAAAQKIVREAKSFPRLLLNVRPTEEVFKRNGVTEMRFEVEIGLSNPSKDLDSLRQETSEHRPSFVSLMVFNKNGEAKFCEWHKTSLSFILQAAKSPARTVSFKEDVVVLSRDDIICFVVAVEEIAGSAVARNVAIPRGVFPVQNGERQQTKSLRALVDLGHTTPGVLQRSKALSNSVQVPCPPGSTTDGSEAEDPEPALSLPRKSRLTTPAARLVSHMGKEKEAEAMAAEVSSTLMPKKASRKASKRRPLSDEAKKANMLCLMKCCESALGAEQDEAKVKARSQSEKLAIQRDMKRSRASVPRAQEQPSTSAMSIDEKWCRVNVGEEYARQLDDEVLSHDCDDYVRWYSDDEDVANARGRKRSESLDIPLAVELMHRGKSPAVSLGRERSESPDVPLALAKRSRGGPPDASLATGQHSPGAHRCVRDLLAMLDVQLEMAFGNTNSGNVALSEEEHFKQALARVSDWKAIEHVSPPNTSYSHRGDDSRSRFDMSSTVSPKSSPAYGTAAASASSSRPPKEGIASRSTFPQHFDFDFEAGVDADIVLL